MLRSRVTSLWQTRMLRDARLTVADEIENALSYYHATFLEEIPAVYADIESALTEHGLPARLPPFLQMGSWIGGDRDGNPNVTAPTLVHAITRQATVIFEHYLDQVHKLGAELSVSHLLAGASDALKALADASPDSSPHRIDEPYRRALIGVYARLVASADERLTANPRLIGKNASIGILRLKHDIGKDSFIGFLGTYRRFVDTYNELGGFDTRLRINKQTTFSAQALVTHSRRNFFYPDLGQSLDRAENAFIYATDYNMSGRHFGYDYSAVGRTRYYRADVGFNRRTNTNNHNLFVRYNSEPKPKAKLISWRVYDDFGTNFDWQGRMQIYNNESQIQFSFPRQTYLGIGMDIGYERVFESEFGPIRQPGSNCVINNTCTFFGVDNERSAGNHGAYVFFGSTPTKKVNFFSFIGLWTGNLDYDFGAGLKFPRVSPAALAFRRAQAAGLCKVDPNDPNKPLPPVCNGPPLDPGAGTNFHWDGNVSYQPSTPLNITLSFTKEKLRRHDTGLVAFDENIVSLRSTYQFTRFIFARGRIDFDSIAATVKGQFLFGWTPNPGTAFYLGYNDDINRHGFNPFSGQLEPGFRRNNRTFFVKMSYLFRRSIGNKSS